MVKILWLIVFSISGMFIYFAIMTIMATFSFWFIDVMSGMVLVDSLNQFLKYPLSIFSKFIKGLLTFVIPYAFTSFYPAAFLLILGGGSMSNGFKIFGGSTGKAFAEKVCSYIGVELGKSTALTFSEGNTFVRIEETVRGQDVYLIQSIGLDPNNELVEILFWLDAFKRASADSVTAIIPYFGYAKGDKKDEPRVSIRARVCAECLELAGADRIVTMDLHSPQVQGFFTVY